MSSTMKGFLVYYDNEVVVCRLPDEEAGKLFKSLFPYGRKSIKPDFENNPALAMAFDILSMAIDQNKEWYDKKCKTNRENIKKRWGASVNDGIPNDTSVYDGIPNDTNVYDGIPNDMNVYDGIPNKDKYKDKNKDKDKNKRERGNIFTPPTVEEVDSYCQSKGYDVSPQRFVDFYESKGWMIGKNKMKDWRAAVRTWVRRDEGNSTQQTTMPTSSDSYAVYHDMYQKCPHKPSPEDPFQ